MGDGDIDGVVADCGVLLGGWLFGLFYGEAEKDGDLRGEGGLGEGEGGERESLFKGHG